MPNPLSDSQIEESKVSSAYEDSAYEHAIGSELSSLPPSVTRYNENRHVPDAQRSDDFDTYGGELCKLPGFHCIEVSPRETWGGVVRNEHDREVIMRLNRTNVALRYRKWIVLPNKVKNLDYMSLSPLPAHIEATGSRQLLVDLRVFAFAAYDEEGDMVYWGPANGGKRYCDENPNEDCRSAEGAFKIYRMQGENCMSSKYPIDNGGGAPMPYCMHYYRGYAIHGSTLGGFVNGSAGCIRLFYNDAKWLNQDFVKLGTRVIVKR